MHLSAVAAGGAATLGAMAVTHPADRRGARDTATARNWTTVINLLELVDEE
jgi:hypothetical protein